MRICLFSPVRQCILYSFAYFILVINYYIYLLFQVFTLSSGYLENAAVVVQLPGVRRV